MSIAASGAALADPIGLASQFTGPDQRLEIVNGGPFQDLAIMTDRNEESAGQRWQVTSEGQWVRIRNEAIGDTMCLDVVNGGDPAYMVQMRPCGNYSGQLWQISASDEHMRFTTQFLGSRYCLDIVNGGMLDRYAQMRPCGDYSGQLWTLVN
ncbi:RICIN domain-containing protein [Rhizobium glycinendophyticum]|uniref:RICIN domain-containing protein n=1 Tax=Rhizobium glycinendophyticum TaxID=2589807 RepID=A0A504UNM9_9HYPH|nr:RICIN domain-containing protein [Rhizobium glycinendophyticum]TPP10606.1 RICIN domain-containing protein [Rhizobium glycinendophyticum]